MYNACVCQSGCGGRMLEEMNETLRKNDTNYRTKNIKGEARLNVTKRNESNREKEINKSFR